jgi:formate dehydrogenase major subunit
VTGIPASDLRAAARLFAAGPNSAIYYGLGVTEHSQGSTMVMGMANLAMLTGNLGREGVGVNPLRGQNNVQGSCDMGSFPHELPGYRHVSRPEVREIYESLWGVTLQAEPGLRIPNMFDSAIGGSFKGLYVQGEDIAQSDPNTAHVEAALRSMDLVVVHDLFLNETARFAHVFLPGLVPGEGRHVHQRRAPDQPGAAGHAEPGRQGRVADRVRDRDGDGLPDVVCRAVADHGRDRRHDTDVRRCVVRAPRRRGVDAVAGHEAAPHGTPTMHVGSFVRGLGQLTPTVYVPTTERANRRFPLVLTTGRILSSTTSARRPGAPRTRRGTPRTSWRSTPRTPSCGASRRATSSSCPRGSARRA